MIEIDLPINTDHLRIRRFRPSDREAFLTFMLDPDCTKFLTFPDELKTEAGASGLLDQVIAAYDSEESIHSYVIALTDDDRYVGSCGLAPYPEGGYEIYYALNPEHRGHGYATEAMAALLSRIPDNMIVRAFCHPKNCAAHAVAEKLGMVSRGEHPHAQFGTIGHLFVRNG